MDSTKSQNDNNNFDINSVKDPGESLVRFVKSFGYPIEEFHNIETEDKYLIEMFRIPHGKTNKTDTPKPVVLILHGLMTSCGDYVVMGPERALAFILADRGYDVWLGNPRGSKFSRNHTEFNHNVDKEYWNFSFHEIGIYDLPAMIAVIQNTTHCNKISYLATSQGTTSLFVLFSEKPQYCDIFKVVICMAPIHKIKNLSGSFLRTLGHNPFIWEPLVKLFGWTSFPPGFVGSWIDYLRGRCYTPGFIRSLVVHMMFIVCGYDYEQLDTSDIPAMLSFIPNPTSVHHYRHFCQTLTTGEFKKYDYGPEENLRRYGQETAPFYDLSKTTCPTALYYSDGGDYICSPLDVKDLKEKLPNLVKDHVIDHSKFNHLDFVFAKDVVDLLYKHIYPVLDKYNFEDNGEMEASN